MSATGSVNLIVLLLLVLPSVCRGGPAIGSRRGTRNGSVYYPRRIHRSAICQTQRQNNRPYNYQDDFMTPGISPCSASLRKHKRQMPNLRRNARGRPHRLQRLCCRLENFGFLASFTRFAVVAILFQILVF
jgi:hypothetical protein